MAFKHLILGVLAQKPSSGYRIRRTFYAPVRPALSQIYRTLSDLADEGLVEYEVVPHPKRPSQNVYSVTKNGRAELAEWLNDTNDYIPTRDEFITKIYFSNFVDKYKTIERLEKYIIKKNEERMYYHNLLNKPSKADAAIKNRSINFYRALGLAYFLQRMDTDLEWAKKAIEILNNSY